MAEWGNFTAREEHGSENVQFSDDGVTATVVLRVPWANRNSVTSDLLANRRPWPKSLPGLVPQARSCGVVPDLTNYTVDAGSEVISYVDALVTVNYTTIEFAQPTVDSIEPTAEFITLDSRCFRWGDGSWVMPEEAPGLLLRGFNFVRTFSDRTDLPHTDYVEKVGAVNDAPVVSDDLGFVFGTETLLYQPPNINWSPNIDGTLRFNVTIKGTFKPQGWNRYFRAFSQSWEYMYLVGDSQPFKSYPPEDLSNVFEYSALP